MIANHKTCSLDTLCVRTATESLGRIFAMIPSSLGNKLKDWDFEVKHTKGINN